MSAEHVSVGCRLPNGLVLEVGYSVSNPGRGGAPFAQYRKGKDYRTHTLRGLNQHSIIRGVDGKPIAVKPSETGREPFINSNVPKDLWDAWLAKYKNSWAVTSGQVFMVPGSDAASAKAVAMDAKSKSSNVFEPMDPKTPMKIEDHTISRRTDE